MRYHLLPFFFAVSMLVSPLVSADTPQINALKQKIAEYSNTIAQNKKTLRANSDRIEKATEAIEDAKQSLAKYEEAHASAQQKYDESSSPENLKLLEMNAKRKMLAEKKVEGRKGRLNKIEAENKKLEASSSSLTALIQENSSKIEKLEEENDRKQAQAAIAAEQARKAKIQAAKAAKIQTPKVPQNTPKPMQASTTAKPEAIAPKKQLEQKIAKVQNPTYANPTVKAVADIKKYLSDMVSESPGSYRGVAEVKRGEDIKLSYLGGDIYRGETPLRKGEHTIIYSGSRFKIEIPSENHRKIHAIYFDERNGTRKMIFLEKSLEDTIK